MRLLEVLRKIVLSLRRLLGLEIAPAEAPALPPGRSAGARETPALAGPRGSSAPPMAARDGSAATQGTAPVGEAPEEDDSELHVEIEGSEGTSAEAVGAVSERASSPSASTPAPAPKRRSTDATAEDTTAVVTTEVEPLVEPEPEAVAVTGAAKAGSTKPPASRRRRRAAAYTQLEPALAVTPVRRFFSRLTAQDSKPLSESSWPQVRVETFFLAVTQPQLDVIRGRGPAIAEPQVLADAFADFVWD